MTQLDYAVTGTPGAPRCVIVLREGPAALVDPDPIVTSAHDVRLLLVRLDEDEIEAPSSYVGETPETVTVDALVRLTDEQAPAEAVAVVGTNGASRAAVALAVALGARVDRLTLVAVHAPETPLDRDAVGAVLGRVTARTLVINGPHETDAAAPAATWHDEHLDHGRVELVAPPGSDGALSISDVWASVLEHSAPNSELS